MSVTPEMLMTFAQQVTGQIFVEGLVQGNFTAQVVSDAVMLNFSWSVVLCSILEVAEVLVWHPFMQEAKELEKYLLETLGCSPVPSVVHPEVKNFTLCQQSYANGMSSVL